jgi:hypothetical protein
MAKFDKVPAHDYSTSYFLCLAGMPKPSRLAEQIKGIWGCNGRFFWGVLSNGRDKARRDKGHPTIPKFESDDVSAIKDSRHLYGFRQKNSHVRAKSSHLVMEARFIDCCCTVCRKGKEDECPYIGQFGKWFDVTLRLIEKGGVAKDKKSALRNPENIPCTRCKRKGTWPFVDLPFFELPLSDCHFAHIGHEEIPKMSMNKSAPKAASPGNVMMLCDNCNGGWHLKCLRPHPFKSAVPLTRHWYCPDCVDPCVACKQSDIYDDPRRRLLRCCECSKSEHMHCMAPPLAEEPRGTWKCRVCASSRAVTRLMAEKKCCAFCHGPVSTGDAGVCECSQCLRLWHRKFPCLQPQQRPDSAQAVYAEDAWLCPECD